MSTKPIESLRVPDDGTGLPAGSGPDAPPPAARRRLAASFLAAALGLAVLTALAFAYVTPEAAPYVAPAVVIVAAVVLWGAARVDYLRLLRDNTRLLADNRRLGDNLESLADTAWELHESEERYRSLIDAEGDLVIHCDKDGLVTFVNPAFTRAFGIPLGELEGRPFAPRPLESGEERRGTGEGAEDIVSRDLRLATVSGPRWFAWVDIRMRDARGAHGPVYSIARDITARKEVEKALTEAREKAVAASRQKSRFLATVSHEFRTPLNGILGLAGLLRETDLTPDQETYARGIESSGEALLGLIDDMLDFARIEAGRLDLRPQPTDVEALLQDVAELLAARAHGKGIDLAVEVAGGLPVLQVDPQRLRQVVLNLAGNAVKFTDRGGVAIAAAVEPVSGGMRLTVSVADSGPGIAPADAERVFGEFEQADGAFTRRHGGAGLGLAICRHIIRHMGGELRLKTRPGEGSEFSFALDLREAGAAGQPPAGVAGLRLLVLSPGPFEARAIVAGLGSAGAEARGTSILGEACGLAGAAAAAGLPYDALVIDARIADGADEALRRLREAAGATVPAVVLLGPADRGRIGPLRAAGFGAYLVRPVRRASLLRIAADVVRPTDTFHADPEDARPRRPERGLPAGRILSVLVAEDNEIGALLARAVVEGLGHRVDSVQDGAAAVAAALPGRYDLVLMDLHMPGLDGIAAARAIREREAESAGPATLIVALTADVLPETRAAALAAGIDEVAEKPVSPAVLRRLLAGLAEPQSAA